MTIGKSGADVRTAQNIRTTREASDEESRKKFQTSPGVLILEKILENCINANLAVNN
jgi:hypothetical protein